MIAKARRGLVKSLRILANWIEGRSFSDSVVDRVHDWIEERAV